MMTAYDIVIRPIITERAMAGAADKKYVFEVAKSAGKVEIKKAVEEIFGVKVASVNTLNVPAKAKRMGAGRPGTTRAWKKAYVTLTADSKTIEFFDFQSIPKVLKIVPIMDIIHRCPKTVMTKSVHFACKRNSFKRTSFKHLCDISQIVKYRRFHDHISHIYPRLIFTGFLFKPMDFSRFFFDNRTSKSSCRLYQRNRNRFSLLIVKVQ